jgi:hypothetical protein
MARSRAIGLYLLAVFAYSALFIFHPNHPNIDALIHYRWSYQYIEALRQGFVPPRWAPLENGGVGAPVFLYYPPVFYLLAVPFDLAIGNLALALRLAVVLAGLGLVATVALSQRAALGRAAWVLGLLVLWAPPSYMVQGFIEAYPWYLSLIPTYLFIHFSLRQARERQVFHPAVPLCFGVLCLSHPLSGFMALIAVPFAWLRYLLASRSDRAAFGAVLCAALGWGAGVALGLALAGAYLLPALGLLGLVNPTGWDNAGGVAWYQMFAMQVFGFAVWRKMLWLTPLTTYVLAGLLVVWLARLREWRNPRISVAVDWLCVALPCLVLACQLSYPIWVIATPLHILQRPFRFLPIAAMATLTAAAYLWAAAEWPAWGAQRLRRAVVATLGGLVASTAALQLGAALLRPDRVVIEPARLREDFGTPEYWPHTRGPDWPDYVRAGGFASECRRLGLTCAASAQDGAFTWTIQAPSPTTLRLPLFAFPSWRMTRNGAPLATGIDPATGLVSIALPAGTSVVQARWHALPAERNGVLLTLAAAVVLAAVQAAGARLGTRSQKLATRT